MGLRKYFKPVSGTAKEGSFTCLLIREVKEEVAKAQQKEKKRGEVSKDK